MKNSKIVKLIAVSLSVLLLVGVSVMISAMADDAPPVYSESTDKLGIASYNLSYQAKTEMAFAVYEDLPEVAAGGSREIYLLFLAADPDASGVAPAADLYNNAMARKTSTGTVKIEGNPYLLFYSNGIKGTDLARDCYVVPVAVDKVPLAEGEGYTYTYTRGYTQKQTVEGAEEITYTARNCNPVAYARQKVTELNAILADETIDEITRKNSSATLAVCTQVISYAADALKRIGETLPAGDSVLIVNNGSIDKNKDGFGTISLNVNDYPEDATVFLRAETKNADGEYFLHWEDSDGEVVSTDRVFANAPVHHETGIMTYTAVYGSASESIYSNTLDLENIVTKDADGNYVAVSTPLVERTFGVAGTTYNETTRSFYNSTTKEEVMVLTNRCHYTANTTNVTGETTLALIDSSYGSTDKNLQIKATGSAYYQNMLNVGSKTADTVEVDFQVNEIRAEGNLTRLIVICYGPSSTACQLIINVAVYGNDTDGYTLKIGSYASGKSVFNETGNPDATPEIDPDKVTGYKVSSLDEIVTIKCVVDDSGTRPSAKVTVNGQLVFAGSAKTFAYNGTQYNNGYFSSFTGAQYKPNSTYIYGFRQYFHANVLGTVTLDNVTFFN